MPTVDRTFEVQAPAAKVWAFLSDFERLGPCLPGCSGVTIISPRDAEWHIEAKVGFIHKKFVVRTHTTEWDEPSHAAWAGESEELSTTGSVDVRSLAAARTEVTYQGTIQAKGPARSILDRYFRSRLQRDIEQFVRNVQEQIEPRRARPEES